MTATISELPHIPIQDRPWLTRAEAASLARVHQRTIDAACRSGLLIEHKGMGEKSGRIKRADLDTWIAGT